MSAFIPYGQYWSTPFAKWQGRLSAMNPLHLVARTARAALERRQGGAALVAVDHAILGLTNPYKGSFYGLPYVTGLMGLPTVAGPTVQQACATSMRALQMASQEVAMGTAGCVLLLMADKQSNGPVVHYPDPTGSGGYGQTEHWVPDNMAQDPFARNSMLQTGENVAARYGFSTGLQHEVKLRRHEQYQQALADDRAFQRRYLIDAPVFDSRFRKQSGVLETDEGVFPTTVEGLARLKPVLETGTITFGGQTHPADGNAGAIVTTREQARALSVDPSIEIEVLGFGSHRADVGYMPAAPGPAARVALQRAGIAAKQLDAIKTHNPFAVNDLALAADLDVPWETMNNYGCSLIWGHPQAPTGLRALIEMIEELVQRGGGTGLFTGCAAGDTGLAAVIRVRQV